MQAPQWREAQRIMLVLSTYVVGRPTKRAAESAEKPASIFGSTPRRNRTAPQGPPMPSTVASSNTDSAFVVSSLAPTVLNVVIDTNVVLDWLVFRNPYCARFSDYFTSGRLRWLASPAMRDELAHVLGRGVCDAWAPDLLGLWGTWDRLSTLTHQIPLICAAARMRSTDVDDQKFIDLALAHNARWLLSRDRAVLKVGRRTRSLGLEVLTPEVWLPSFSPC